MLVRSSLALILLALAGSPRAASPQQHGLGQDSPRDAQAGLPHRARHQPSSSFEQHQEEFDPAGAAPIRNRMELLAAYPHLFPSCQALLHILERTEEGREALKAQLALMQRLQYALRTARMYDLDLGTLAAAPDSRSWEPYTVIGLRLSEPQPVDSQEPQSGSSTISNPGAEGPEAVATDEVSGHRAAEATEAEAAGGSKEGAKKAKRSAAKASAMAAASAAAAAAEAAAAVATQLAAAASGRSGARRQALAEADASAPAEAEAGASTTGAEAPAEGEPGAEAQAEGGAAPVPLLRPALVERVLKGEGDREELLDVLERRRVAAEAEAAALQPRVDRGLVQLRVLLRAAATADAPRLASAPANASDLVADPSDLELYDLLLGPCVLARLDPRNYVSYPPVQPVVSAVLSYSGRRLPAVLQEVVNPLLACAAGEVLQEDAVAAAAAASGAAVGATGGDNGTTAAGWRGSGPFPPLAVELFVGYDEVSEAANWASIAADSGGRVVPIFRPAATAVPDAAAAAAETAAEIAAAAASAPADAAEARATEAEASAAGPPSGAASSAFASATAAELLLGLNRLAAVAQGEVLLVLRDDAPPPPQLCAWLHTAARAFAAWPRLGALGGGGFVADWHPAAANRGLAFWDAANDLPMQFVSAVLRANDRPSPAASANGSATGIDPAAAAAVAGPLAVRRSAWRQLGGVDAGLGGGAACGACGELDLSTRLWLAGWQVAHMPVTPAAAAAGGAPGFEGPWPFLRPGDLRNGAQPAATATPGPGARVETSSSASLTPADAAAKPVMTAVAVGPGAAAAAAAGVSEAEVARTVEALGTALAARAAQRANSSGAAATKAAGRALRADAVEVTAQSVGASAVPGAADGPAERLAGGAGRGAAAADAPWCERAPPRWLRRQQAGCARLLQMRYGRSAHWADLEGGTDAGAGAGAASAGAGGGRGEAVASEAGPGRAGAEGGSSGGGRAGAWDAWFLGSELHVHVAEHARRLNLQRLTRLRWPGREWECPFGAGGCEAGEATWALGLAMAPYCILVFALKGSAIWLPKRLLALSTPRWAAKELAGAKDSDGADPGPGSGGGGAKASARTVHSRADELLDATEEDAVDEWTQRHPRRGRRVAAEGTQQLLRLGLLLLQCGLFLLTRLAMAALGTVIYVGVLGAYQFLAKVAFSVYCVMLGWGQGWFGCFHVLGVDGSAAGMGGPGGGGHGSDGASSAGGGEESASAVAAAAAAVRTSSHVMDARWVRVNQAALKERGQVLSKAEIEAAMREAQFSRQEIREARAGASAPPK
ncbi:hypothetical protein HYH03_002482 [Edaphochlamys debaryana]|uniref:Uncharacterized protein n=1 Tax=Edaphochlamys debaryana TaxID=47281 RepID=A0A835YEQ1_9CHLO|nr:hypothetical protein HYH03_002482 [Edaphochlamys debaryana]|eukprot:KAG2499536.1 hypothetical protein HYH03_002482 [Edaphochlamys debaryana]